MLIRIVERSLSSEIQKFWREFSVSIRDMRYSAGSRSWMKMRNMQLYQRKPIMGLSDMTVL